MLVLAVILVAMNNDLVTDFPAGDLVPDGPNDPGRIRAGDVVGLLMPVKRRDRHAERGPDTVIVHASGHHIDQHFMAIQLRGFQNLQLHGGIGLAVALPADRPCIHLFRHMSQGRDLAHFIEVFHRCIIVRYFRRRIQRGHGRLLLFCVAAATMSLGLPHPYPRKFGLQDLLCAAT